MKPNASDTAMTDRLRWLLFELARQQDRLADDEAAATPYWAPCPASVLGHREAAAALRAGADVFPAAS